MTGKDLPSIRIITCVHLMIYCMISNNLTVCIVGNEAGKRHGTIPYISGSIIWDIVHYIVALNPTKSKQHFFHLS